MGGSQLDYFERSARRRRYWHVRRLFMLLGVIGLMLSILWVAWRNAPQSTDAETARERSVYYPNCAAARAAGAAPIHMGEPGYRPALDADNDGIACEPIPLWAR